jgi:hypothetical protein
MKSISKFSLVLTVIWTLAASALASPADSALAALLKARASLVTLLDTSDAAAQKNLEGEIRTATKEVDDSVKSALADKATPKEAAAKLKEFDGVWKDFKKTRDGEIIPAVKAGKVDAAKALAKGVQAERMGKMKELLAAAGAK